MNAVTGPYAKRIFEDLLGAAPGTVLRSTPLPDFGGCHPDPNLVHAADLVKVMYADEAPNLGAASDGDGDRNLILGPNTFVSPGDSLAVIVEHAANCIPGYKDGLKGVARSMPTSQAADKVAEQLGINCFETPTGWKFFASLLDENLITVCGEESFGTSSNHVREKDGLWAVLCWLSILAVTKKSVGAIMSAHWKKFGRSYFQRHDYEELPAEPAGELMEELRSSLSELEGKKLGTSIIDKADDFSYVDPIDGSRASKQGIRLLLKDGSRAVVRLSGTGTKGATLRLYYETYKKDDFITAPEVVLKPLIQQTRELLKLKERFSLDEPTVIT